MSEQFISILGIIIPIAVVIFLVLFLLATGYVKASPDTAYIISGLRKQDSVF